MISKEERERIEKVFTDRMIMQNVKYGSKDYYKRQLEFFCGASAAIGEINVPPYWFICLSSSREIIEDYERV